jgi:hypothetical protein
MEPTEIIGLIVCIACVAGIMKIVNDLQSKNDEEE